MARSNRDIWQWQQDFNDQPHIWFTMDSEQNPCNFYDTKEAAMLELEWMKKRPHMGRVSVGSSPVHNLDLSRRRWLNPTPGDPHDG